MIIFEFILLLIILPLQYGALARLGVYHFVAPDLLLIATWLFAWLADRRDSLTWAVMIGLAISLINFQRFGLWLFVYVLMVSVIEYLRARYFEISSLVEALICLIVSNIIFLLIAGLLAGQYPLTDWLINISVNVIIGALFYILLAKRLRLYQHWRGSRL